MTLTAPIPIQAPPRHPPITVQARIALTANGLAWRDILTQMQGRLELTIIGRLDSTPWSILDGHTAWTLAPARGEAPAVILEGIWQQR
jgi:hypothetical protein